MTQTNTQNKALERAWAQGQAWARNMALERNRSMVMVVALNRALNEKYLYHVSTLSDSLPRLFLETGAIALDAFFSQSPPEKELINELERLAGDTLSLPGRIMGMLCLLLLGRGSHMLAVKLNNEIKKLLKGETLLEEWPSEFHCGNNEFFNKMFSQFRSAIPSIFMFGKKTKPLFLNPDFYDPNGPYSADFLSSPEVFWPGYFEQFKDHSSEL